MAKQSFSWRFFSEKKWLPARVFSMLCNILCLVSASAKTIRLFALDLYEVILDLGFALIELVI